MGAEQQQGTWYQPSLLAEGWTTCATVPAAKAEPELGYTRSSKHPRRRNASEP